jgi:hypothetical protein
MGQYHSFPSGYPVSPTVFVEEVILLPSLCILSILAEIGCPYINGFNSVLSILFSGSVYMFLSQYHIVLFVVASHYILKSGSIMSPCLFFFY